MSVHTVLRTFVVDFLYFLKYNGSVTREDQPVLYALSKLSPDDRLVLQRVMKEVVEGTIQSSQIEAVFQEWATHFNLLFTFDNMRIAQMTLREIEKPGNTDN